MDNLYEPSFGIDDFRKPLAYKGSEAFIKAVIIILFGKPGFYPSIPNLGLNIQQYRNSKFSDLNVEILKGNLIHQLSLVDEGISNDELKISLEELKKDQPILLIQFNINDEEESSLLGITSDGENVSYNYILSKIK